MSIHGASLKNGGKNSFLRRMKTEYPLHLMLLVPLILVFIYRYLPLMGLILAFQKFDILAFADNGFFASKFVGLKNFRFVFGMPEFPRALWNSFYIAMLKTITGFICPIVLALLLNELRALRFKRIVQTLVYLPHFLSWVILGGILLEVLSLDGVLNHLLGVLGLEPIFFLGDNKVFPSVLVISDLWRNVGWGTIIYLAAITTVNSELYEAMAIDGAGRFQQVLHVTIPAITPIMVLVGTLSLGSILDAGFDQIYVLYTPPVYQSADIIDTLTYRIGMQQIRYDIATTIGLFKSAVSLVLLSVSYGLARKFANYRIF